ncbi:NAD-dependent protein deacetylase [Pseudoxanthomonas sp. SL93]|uniref:NAD-dependent protein deacetylase n=1 Tax=Pseudoxanthomonas sp. SL93 TaxID=2995142 RepID=UPI00226DE67B|nr:NAD-dependent protein deacetylase [Pseudoxanthomonas sp. SL93]WAC62849.1 NAD-dependent protein deacetylase [Pseudoxanthomonas sp. SL93]
MIDERLESFITTHRRIFVLTGAGCSTDSGIPDYRDAEGGWKRAQPVTYQAFMGEAATRRRYWARSLVGWPRIASARPNVAHRALAQLEERGQCELLLTQNVDGLHQAAGSHAVVDLHGRLDMVRCMACEQRTPRADLQRRLVERNPAWAALVADTAPDGDADLEGRDFDAFDVPECEACGGVLKPDVVFFGENVPQERVRTAMDHLQQADAMLVVGSSLMVWSGFRFVHAAVREGIPVGAVNLGRTRGDDLLRFRVAAPCGPALSFLLEAAASAPAR